MDIGKLINKRRTELKLTLEEVGNAVGVSKSTVKKWEDGFISNMRRDKISELARILKLNPVSLITGEESEQSLGNIQVLPNDNVYMIPVFESVSAGFGAYACSDVTEYFPMYIENPADAADMLCIKVKGDSMYPKIEEGDIVAVRKQSSVDSGSLAVMLIDGEEGVVKKVNYGPDWIELISINPMYPPRRFEGAEVQRLQVVGLVKKVIKNV